MVASTPICCLTVNRTAARPRRATPAAAQAATPRPCSPPPNPVAAADVRLSLRVLRRLAGPLEPVLLALLHPRIAGQQPGLAKRQSMRIRIDLEQGARDAVADRAGLTRDSAAFDLDHRVEAALGPGDPERHADFGLVDGVAEVLVERATVHDDLPLAGEQTDPGDRRLAATCPGVESRDRHFAPRQ